MFVPEAQTTVLPPVVTENIAAVPALPIIDDTAKIPVLRVENLEVRYSQQVGCSRVNFSIAPGERVAVIGPNGAGKSSLFKAIVNLVAVYKGQVLVGGQSHLRGSSGVGYVPQHEAVDWKFPVNVWDVVMMARTRHVGYIRRPRRLDRDMVKKALQQVDLWGLHHRQIGQLSGGQRRRVFIARALAQEAQVILMDEPFAGVDATTEAEIFAVLDELRAQNITVVVATHNLAQASTHYDKVLMINQEQIAFGCAADVFTAENLSRTFGGHITFWENGNRLLVVSDTPCH